MKTKLLYCILGCATAWVAMPALHAQSGDTSSGTLSVTASVADSISLTFVSDGSGVTLTGSGTDTATLDYGTVKAFAPPITGVTKTNTAETSFSVATPFDVRVVKANSTSSHYTLKATLSSADSVNGWLIDAVDVHGGSEQ